LDPDQKVRGEFTNYGGGLPATPTLMPGQADAKQAEGREGRGENRSRLHRLANTSNIDQSKRQDNRPFTNAREKMRRRLVTEPSLFCEITGVLK